MSPRRAVDRIDPLALARRLGVPAPAHARPVLGGADTSIWRIDSGDGALAVRVFPRGRPACPRAVHHGVHPTGSKEEYRCLVEHVEHHLAPSGWRTWASSSPGMT